MIDRFNKSIGLICLSFGFLLLAVSNTFGAHKISNNAYLKPVKNTGTVSNLQVEYRHGQVFLIWDELEQNDQNLRVYISREPITGKNLSKARLLTDELEPHSANDWYDDPDECPRAPGPAHGWVIQANREPLTCKEGLFVHTVSKKDPHLAYFAILGKKENAGQIKPGVNSLQKPIAVSVAPIQPIWQLEGSPPTAKGKALAIFLHSHLSRPGGKLTYLFFGNSSMGWREGLPFKFKVTLRPDAVLLEPYDRVWINRKMGIEEAKANGIYDTQYKNIESWWYGTNSKINNPDLIASGTPTNYTERWILWAMDWIQKNYGTNPNQVYAFGASMGTGIFRMVLHDPNRFASVDLLVPILDPFGEGNVGARMAPRVGNPQSICSDGMKLTDRLNTINSINIAKTDLPPMVIRIGHSDQSVFWIRKPALIKAAQQQKQAMFVGWDNGTHATAMRKPHEGFPNWFNFKWHIDHFAINKSFPALTGCSLDSDPGNGQLNVGDTTGYINRGFDWKIISDSKSDYQISLSTKQPQATYPAYVNVTPRRCQQFHNMSNATVYAYNINPKGEIIEKKVLKADKNGLITYDKFALTSAEGNTLVISKTLFKNVINK